MSDRDEIPRYLENWQDEVDSAAEYRAMAAAEADPRLAKVYSNLAAMEESHIAFWEDRLRKAGGSVPSRRPSWRSRVLGAIARRFGPELVLPTIAAKEAVDQNAYLKQPETADTRMAAHERWHAKVLEQLVTSQPRGLQGTFLGRLEGRHRSVGGNALRAAVLGANDGLCSNLSLVMGVAGTMVRRLLADRATAIDALAREELGIDPKDLGGSPWEAAVASFVLFAIGAVVPILPFVVMRGTLAVASSVVISGLALFAIGG